MKVNGFLMDIQENENKRTTTQSSIKGIKKEEQRNSKDEISYGGGVSQWKHLIY